MPDLEQYRDELNQIAVAAEKTTQRLLTLRQEMLRVLQASIRGGQPVQSRIESVADRLIAGTPVANRARVGGGARVAINPELQAKLSAMVNQYVLESVTSQIQQLRLASAGGGGKLLAADAAFNEVLQTADKALVDRFNSVKQQLAERKAMNFTPAEDALDQLSVDVAKKVAADIKQLETQLTNQTGMLKYLGKPLPATPVTTSIISAPLSTAQTLEQISSKPEELKTIQGLIQNALATYKLQDTVIESINKHVTTLAGNWASVKSATVSTKDGLDTIRITLEDINKKTSTFSAKLSATGQVSFTGAGQDKPTKTIKDYYKDIEKGFGETTGPALSKKIQEVGASLQSTFGAIEKVSATSIRGLDTGLKRVNVSFSNAAGGSEKLTLYIKTLGNQIQVLTKQELQAAQTLDAMFTPEKLAASLGSFRSQQALALAQKSGFGIKNLKSVYTQQPSGVSILNFEDTDKSGVMQKLEIATDRFGGVLTRTNKRLLGFFESIVRNTTEVIRWSVGVGLVYGTMAKFQELLKLAIDNQAKLADITVVLGNAQRDVNSIFNDAARIAKETGESINTVLEAYVSAYRAVGGVEDPIKRTAAANQLLTDATVLNKLSSLDSAEAIDVLSGSLRQLQKPQEDVTTAFGRGTELLDSWVAVSRRANVDLSTLATAFSVTSESAENSGVSIQELNAIIAVLAEKIGGLGGKETGNAVRALIGGVYQQQAAEALSQYGIAITDTTGKMRPFLDISKNIYDLYDKGIISSEELNKIAYVLGGGVRRGQQYVAFLSDFARIQEIVGVQANAAGSAEEALGKKLDTVQTVVTRLGNSFQSLAQTLGNEGGVLDTMGGVLKVATALVGVFDSISKILGNITIPAALVTLASLYFRGDVGAAKLRSAQGRIGGFVANATTGALGFGSMQNTESLIYTSEGPRRQTVAGGYGQRAGFTAGKYGMGIMAGAYPAISRLSQGQPLAAAADIAGAVAGTLISKGSMIGGVLGSAIAEVFVQAALYEPDFQNFFKNIISGGTENEPKEPSKGERLRKEATTATFREAGFGSQFIGTLRSQLRELATNVMMSGYAIGVRAGGQKYEWEGITTEQAALSLAPGAMGKVQAAAAYTPTEIAPGTSRISLRQDEIDEAFNDFIDQLAQKQRDTLRDQSVKQEIKPKEYQEGLKATYGLASSVTKLFAVLNQEGQQFLQLTDKNKASFEDFSELLLNTDSQDSINALTTEIFDLDNAIESLSGKAPDALAEFGEQMLTTAQLTDLENQKLQDLITLLGAIREQAKLTELEKFKLPGTVDLEGYDTGEMNAIVQRARGLQENWLNKNISEGFLTEEGKQLMIDKAEPVFIYLGKLLGYYLTKGISDTKFLGMAEDLALQEGAIQKTETSPLDFRTFDLTISEFQKILAQYPAMLAKLQARGYVEDPSSLIPVLKDGITDPLSRDWKIMELLLQQIADNTEKQVEGMFNLPSGSTFYVPFRAAELDANSRAGGTGTGDLGNIGGDVESGAYKGIVEGMRNVFGTYPGSMDKPPATPLEKFMEKDLADMLKPYGPNPESPRYPGSMDRPPGWPIESFTAKSGDAPGGFMDILNGVLNNLNTTLNSLLAPLLNLLNPDSGINSLQQSPLQLTNTNPELNKSLQTKLQLDLTSNIQLVVDGRVLANVIKPYLYVDLLRFDSVTGSTSKSLVI
jgi:TP901 family phage tail tape measure protein